MKVGIILVKEGQCTEEEVLENNDHSHLFDGFLQVLGDRIRLKGFDKYKGGLDTVHDLTGKSSIYTHWRGIEIMFHVSTLLPYEKQDPQKLQRKRHIGNDIVCIVFLEAKATNFNPSCIKSHFLHTFIIVQVDPETQETPVSYKVSVVSRDEVEAYKPFLWQKSSFTKGPLFREWLLTKIVNGERASYSAPKFARMQDRTRSQLLEDIVTNLQNHAETGQIPKPYRRGSWRPIGHMRPSSPLLDSMRDLFEGYEQLAKDFTKAFKDTNAMCDIVFNVGQGKDKVKVYAVRAILAVRSRVFQEMLYGIASGLIGTSQSPLEALNRAVTPTKSNFLQVPEIYEPRHKSAPSSPMVMRAFSRLARWDWSGKKQESSLLQVEQDNLRRWTSDINCNEKKDSKQDAALLVPRLSVCADIQKVDRNKLMQSEFNIIEFDPDTFETLLEYLHTGSCPIMCRTIPGLICAAEHFDLPELLQACFHHAKQHLHINIVCAMLNSLENYYWRYTSASELVNMILVYVDTRAPQVFECSDFFELSESMVQMILSRELSIPEVHKFRTMLDWSKSKVKRSQCRDSNFEFRCTMERLTRDLKLYNISPTDLIKTVLPTKAIRNERILETLMYQANSGMYRVQPSYIQECRVNMERKESRPDIQLYGMFSFDRRDSITVSDEYEHTDFLMEEHTALVHRQQSLNQEMLPSSLPKAKTKRRVSKVDFHPLQRQEGKRRGSKQIDSSGMQQYEQSPNEERLSVRRESKLFALFHRQDSRSLEESTRTVENKASAHKDSKIDELRSNIKLHRQESKMQEIEIPTKAEGKGYQRRDSKIHDFWVHSVLHRQESRAQEDEATTATEKVKLKKETKSSETKLKFSFGRQGSEEDGAPMKEKNGQRRDSKIPDFKLHLWFQSRDETESLPTNEKRKDSRESDEVGLWEGEDGSNFSPHNSRRDSKSQDNSKVFTWFSRRDSKPDDAEGSGGESDNISHPIASVERAREDVDRIPARSSHRRNSKLFNWFMKTSMRSQDEDDPKERREKGS